MSLCNQSFVVTEVINKHYLKPQIFSSTVEKMSD
jgi:hypothetical protein